MNRSQLVLNITQAVIYFPTGQLNTKYRTGRNKAGNIHSEAWELKDAGYHTPNIN